MKINNIRMYKNIKLQFQDNGRRLIFGDKGDVYVAKKGWNFDPSNIKYFPDYYDENANTGKPEEMFMAYPVELEKNKWGMERMFIRVRESDMAIIDISTE